MREIKKIPDRDCASFLRLKRNSYPSAAVYKKKLEEFKKTTFRVVQKQRKNSDYYGYYEDGKLLGAMTRYSFSLNFNGSLIGATGLGGVAVDLNHKKERICLSLVRSFHDMAREEGLPMALLYPFNPAFYAKMGYGTGQKELIYRIDPAMIPDLGRRENVIPLDRDSCSKDLVDCYKQSFRIRHGHLLKDRHSYDYFLEEQNSYQVMGFPGSRGLEGFVLYKFGEPRPGNRLAYDLIVGDMVFNTPDAFRGIMSHLAAQSDQVRRIVFYSQDPDFHHFFRNPADDSGKLHPGIVHQTGICGTGVMYRIVDTRAFFRCLTTHNFNNANLTLNLVILDDLEACCNGPLLIKFTDGRATLLETGTSDAGISMKIGHFSSLVMGAVRFESLYAMGLCEISDTAYVQQVDRLFATPPPVCSTYF